MSSPPRLSRRAQWSGGGPISQLMSQALARPELISLAAGFVDHQTLPVEAVRQAACSMLADVPTGRAALQYGTTPGFEPLREMLLARTLAADGPWPSQPSIGQVVVTAGSNQLLYLVADTLADPGDIVLCAAPTYFVFLAILGNLGVRSVGVAPDADGLVPEALEDQLLRLERFGELARVKAIYVCSYFDNPTSMTLPATRRQRLVELARRWSKHGTLYIIEDVAYRELRYSGQDVPSLGSFDERGDTVVQAGTFSKSFSPGIRVGWGILPPALVAPICDQKGNIDFGSPNFGQHLMAGVLGGGQYDTHVAALRRRYHCKLTAMLQAADKWLRPLPGVTWQQPTGGLYLWLQLPKGMDAGPSGRLLRQALTENVLYVPGEYCYGAEGQKVGKNTIRLSFGVQDEAGIERGIEGLARAIERAR